MTHTNDIGAGLGQDLILTSKLLIMCHANDILSVWDINTGKLNMKHLAYQIGDKIHSVSMYGVTGSCCHYDQRTNVIWIGLNNSSLFRIDLSTSSSVDILFFKFILETEIEYKYVHHVSKWYTSPPPDVRAVYFDDNRVITQYGSSEVTCIDFTPLGMKFRRNF